MAHYFQSQQSLDNFRADATELMKDKYKRASDGAEITGVAETVLSESLRGSIPGSRRFKHSRVSSGRTWSFSGGPSGFCNIVEEAGFVFVEARNARGNRAMVVTSP